MSECEAPVGQYSKVLGRAHHLLVCVHEEGHHAQGQHLVVVSLALTQEDAACEGVQDLR